MIDDPATLAALLREYSDGVESLGVAIAMDEAAAALDRLAARVAELEAESDGRRRVLLQVVEERHAEWRRAEAAEAALAPTEANVERLARVLCEDCAGEPFDEVSRSAYMADARAALAALAALARPAPEAEGGDHG